MNTSWTRFWKKVEVIPGGCWLWKASKFSNGYGYFHVRQDGERKANLAHRWCYEQMKGPIPEGLDLDHTCRVRHCVNPDHLEPVTRSMNLSRSPLMGRANSSKTHCKHGHLLDGDNVYLINGHRHCKRCKLERNRQIRARIKQDPEALARRRREDAEFQRKKREQLKGGKLETPNSEKTHCPQGHPYEGRNLMVGKNGARRCRQCVADACKRAYLKRQGKQ